MKLKKHIFTTLGLFIFSFNGLLAQNSLDKAWDYFLNNELNKTRTQTESFKQTSENYSNAKLLESFANQIDKDPKESFKSFAEALEKVDNINPYLYAMWQTKSFLNGESYIEDDKLELLEEFLESGKLNETMKLKTYLALGSHYSRDGNEKKSEEYYSKAGNIIEWSVLGHFNNISGSGFNKDFGVLENNDNTTYYNKNDAKVDWITLPQYPKGRWLYPTSHMYGGNSIYYAQNFVKSNIDQIVQFRLGRAGSVKVWINDKLMFEEEKEKDLLVDVNIFTVKLNKGYNRILIQLGEGEDVNSTNFFVRLTDSKGNNIENLDIETKNQSYKKELNFENEKIPHFAETFFEEKYESIKENPNSSDMLYHILLAQTYILNDKFNEARKVILAAREIAPNSSFISNILLQVYNYLDAETLYSEEFERIKKIDERNPIVIQDLYSEAMDKNEYETARKYIDKLERVVGTNELIYTLRISYLFSTEEREEGLKLMSEAYDKFPTNYTFVTYKYLIDTEINKNEYAGIKTLKKYLKKRHSTSVERKIANIYIKLGQASKALKIFEDQKEKYPYNIDRIMTLADYHYNTSNYGLALKYYNEAHDIAPYISSIFNKRASCERELDNKSKATKAYEQAIYYNPLDYDTRSIYREYTDQKEIFSYFEEPDLEELYENSPSSEEYPEDNSVILWDETQKVVYETGGSEEKRYFLVKVFNPSGVDAWKDYYIYGIGKSSNIIKAEVLKANGNKLKAETSGRQIVFKNLEEGDAILLIYTQKVYSYGKLLKHFDAKEAFTHFYPYKKTKYSLMVPPKTEFKYVFTNDDMEPEIKDIDDEFKMYVWEKTDIKSVKSESRMPSLYDFGKVLHISSMPNWQFVNDWYYDISKTKAKSDYEVKEVIEELFNGKQDEYSDLEKAKKIYKYVVEEIRYSSIPFRQDGVVPQKASKVINTRIGDCKDVATLFNALCSEVGIKTDIVLVNTRDNGQKDIILPGIGFNHAISKAYIDGKEYYVELTSDYIPFGTMGYSLKNAFILEINDQEEGAKPIFAKSENRPPNSFNRSADISFENNKMIVEREGAKYGSNAASMRSTYRDIGEKERMKELQESISDDFAKVELVDVKFDSTVYNQCDSIYFYYKFEVQNPFTKLGSYELMKLPFTVIQEPVEFMNTKDRKHPIAFWRFETDEYQKETLNIKIPDGKKLFEKPKDVVLDSKWAKYSLTFKYEGDILIATREMIFKGIDIIDVEEYDKFTEFYGKVIKADESQIGFK